MREILSLNKNWFFHRGDIVYPEPRTKGYAHRIARLERAKTPPANRFYEPNVGKINPDLVVPPSFESVDLPHDYIIKDEPKEDRSDAWGYVEYVPAWYIKHIDIPAGYEGRRLILFFEGIAGESVIYVNGCLMERSVTGYTPVEVDISDVALYGEKNVIAVYTDPSKHEGWWYEGSGIYRTARLEVSDRLCVDRWGVYVKPVFDGKVWNVTLSTDVINDNYNDENFTVRHTLYSPDGNVCAVCEDKGAIAKRTKATFVTSAVLPDAHRWSPETPERYTCFTEILKDGSAVDGYETRFGLRTWSLDPEKGFFINGRHYKIKGFCGHADCGLFGKAVPENIHRYKVQLMKEMGANGYRTSHYFQAETLMEELDKNGFIVMDEARWYESTPEGLRQTEALVRRDRNRPSVFFWSIGNEEDHHATEQGRRVFKALKEKILSLDETRIITAAVNLPDECKVFDLCDVIGINYHWDGFDRMLEKIKDKPFLSSECCATGTTRGHYFDADKTRGYLSAYDAKTNSNFQSREWTWKKINSTDRIIGCYQWIAFEHRGEAEWPRLCSQSGAVDLFMQKKDAFYQNRSHFAKEKNIHLLPHWNFKGLEGREIRVVAYTNVPECELFLNGRSLGRVTVEKYGHAEWQVPFEAGRLEAVGYEDGKEVVRDTRVTPGEPYRLVLEQDTKDVRANGEDFAIVSCHVEDKDGNPVDNACPTVRFSTEGDCSVWTTGSDISDHTTLFSSERKMREGRIGVSVKLGSTPDGMTVYAAADGLLCAALDIKVKGE